MKSTIKITTLLKIVAVGIVLMSTYNLALSIEAKKKSERIRNGALAQANVHAYKMSKRVKQFDANKFMFIFLEIKDFIN